MRTPIHRACRRIPPASAIALVVAFATTLAGCGNTTEKDAGLPHADGLPDVCILGQNDKWSAASTVGTVSYGGKAPGLHCGYVVRKSPTTVAVTVGLTAKCRYVGNLDPNSISGCNNQGYPNIATSNRIRIVDYISTTTTNNWFDWAVSNVDNTLYKASKVTLQSLAPNRTDFFDSLIVTFQSGPGLGDIAIGKSTMRGQVKNSATSLVGPSSSEVSTGDTWSASVPGYATDLFQYKWYVDGTLRTGETSSSLTTTIAGPGSKVVRALVQLADSAIDTVSVTVMPILHAGISGPNSISSPGYYTWTSDATGNNGATVTYDWELWDPGVAQWTSLGTGSTSASLLVDQNGPATPFQIYLYVSATGFQSSSANKEVANTLIPNCGGYACLRVAPNPKKPTTKASAASAIHR